jgi:hypothetical protein
MKQVRQGDVLLQRINPPPVCGEKQPPDGERVILAYGEATGHAHALSATSATLYLNDSHRYLQVTDPLAYLDHEEHSRITLKKGWYEVVQQREWEIGNVAD